MNNPSATPVKKLEDFKQRDSEHPQLPSLYSWLAVTMSFSGTSTVTPALATQFELSREVAFWTIISLTVASLICAARIVSIASAMHREAHAQYSSYLAHVETRHLIAAANSAEYDSQSKKVIHKHLGDRKRGSLRQAKG